MTCRSLWVGWGWGENSSMWMPSILEKMRARSPPWQSLNMWVRWDSKKFFFLTVPGRQSILTVTLHRDCSSRNSQPWWHHPSWEMWLMPSASGSPLPSFHGAWHHILVCWPCHCLAFFPVFFDILCYYCKPGCGFWEGWLAGSVRLKHWNVGPRGGSQISSLGPEASLPW